MKYEASQAEGTFALLLANINTVVLGAFAQYDAQIAALTKGIEENTKKLKELTDKYEPKKKEINNDKPEGK